MDTARMSESYVAAQDRCTPEVHLPRFQHNRFMERNTMKFVVLPEKNAEQDGFPWNFHFLLLLLARLVSSAFCQ
jgi:hypothetical protein